MAQFEKGSLEVFGDHNDSIMALESYLASPPPLLAIRYCFVFKRFSI